jgi:hypothetical protein
MRSLPGCRSYQIAESGARDVPAKRIDGGAPITPLCVAGGTGCGLDSLWRPVVGAGSGGRSCSSRWPRRNDSIGSAVLETGSLSGDLAMLARQQVSTLSGQEVIETSAESSLKH